MNSVIPLKNQINNIGRELTITAAIVPLLSQKFQYCFSFFQMYNYPFTLQLRW